MFCFGDDVFVYGDEDFYGFLCWVVGVENFGFDGFRDGVFELFDEFYCFFVFIWGKCEYDVFGLDFLFFIFCIVIVYEFDCYISVVNGLRNKLFRVRIRFGV